MWTKAKRSASSRRPVRAKQRALAILALLGAPLLACTHTSYITPWFRIVTEPPPPTLIAESGGPKAKHTAERLTESGDWSAVSESPTAIALGDGDRVLLSDPANGALVWLDRQGRRGPFPCVGRPYVPANGDNRGRVLCVELEVAESTYGRVAPPSPVPLAFAWLDPLGSSVGPRHEVTIAGNPYRSWSERTLLGLLDGELVFAIENGRESTESEEFPGKECSYIVLGASGPRPLGKRIVVDQHPPYVRATLSSCDESGALREALGGISLTALRSLY